MKIALCSSFVPFVNGGYRHIVEWLQAMLEEKGYQVERIYLPQVDLPDVLFQQMMAYRWVDLQAADRVICFRPQAHLIPHPHKILWFIHHIRLFYDLWDSPYQEFSDDFKHQGIRNALHDLDTVALKEAKAVFTNSKLVSKRLKKYNNIESNVLYPPVFKPERFHCVGFNDEIVCVCRIEHHKRQHLLIEALRYTKTPVRLRLSGSGTNENYLKELGENIKKWGLSNRVSLDNRWISEEEKIEYLSTCLATAYLPLDEDSYGYPSVEASHASKSILTTLDSGGVLELVQDEINGYVTEASPQALGDAMDRLFLDREKTKLMGDNARERLTELNVSWDYVLQRMLE
jgi:glycosyltransferase involved in cell wall biosynthesis